MRHAQRLIAAAVLIAFAGVLSGCSGFGSNFDPSDLLDWLDTKKKLPGDRKPVFPEGVPGLEQGVPKDLYKGAQQQNDQAAANADAAQPPAEAPPQKQQAKSNKSKAHRPHPLPSKRRRHFQPRCQAAHLPADIDPALHLIRAA